MNVMFEYSTYRWKNKNYLINVCIKWDVIITQILFAHFRSFKSFRLKKKSSTLGINKTSESPPMLRRDDNAYDYNNATLDPQLRHTIDVGLSNNFQRGAAYRNSLQDLNSRVRNNLCLFVFRWGYWNCVIKTKNSRAGPTSFLRAKPSLS